MSVIKYELPNNWIAYDPIAVSRALAEAKASFLALTYMPFQREWAEKLQNIQLKREVAGTSRIEGAEFTERELDAALNLSPQELETRSQKQAASAISTYRWITNLATDIPITEDLIKEIHRRMVTGCDDDHCPPGKIRGRDENVTFGSPRHRGVEGGDECKKGFQLLIQAVNSTFLNHDPLIQALALHYHFAAMHPFLDGNGRTARAMEALMLQKVGLKDTLFIAMSNYYYEEKIEYLKALGDARAGNHDLTPFLIFALKGIEIQCKRLSSEIKEQLTKALFRNTVTDLFGRLQSPRKRVISERHVKLLNLLLDSGSMPLGELTKKTRHFYILDNPTQALVRDLNYLLNLKAISFDRIPDTQEFRFHINLKWPTEITETEFFKRTKNMPKGKVHGFLSS